MIVQPLVLKCAFMNRIRGERIEWGPNRLLLLLVTAHYGEETSMTVEQIERLLSDLCYFSEVDITHTFSFNGLPILQIKCLTINAQYIFELTYITADKIDYFSDKAEAAKVITDIISIDTPV